MQLNSNIHLPGFEAFTIQKSEEVDGIYYLHVDREVKNHRCPACGAYTSNVHDYRVQKIQHTRIFGRQVYVFYRKRRYVCRSGCGKRFYEDNPLVERYQRQSMEMKQAVAMELIHGKSFRDVAHRFDTSPTTVIRRFDYITAPLLDETQTLPDVIAIDEYKGDAGGETYQTIIADPVNRKPLEILADRRKETVKNYLRKHGERVKMVVMDMSHSFKAAVDQALGHPIIIADRFHFCRYIYWALERVRRQEQNAFDDYDRKKCKRMKHVFYKQPETLTDKQAWYLERYLQKSAYLKRAYQLKEAYRLWFETAKENGSKHLGATKAHLYEFYDLVRESGVTEFEQAIGTLQNWQKEIMNTFGFELHNGYIEGINNQTKVLKRNAFGFKRFDRFRAKVLLHHQYKKLDIRVA
ncbi:ISL3 family transposase [Virgibacillus sp. NKC19-3]|uniref:ISL3 family transposase n=1 Tax=Virgibacillus saliphilus TaxID=2831674 RepID=UPI001C9A8EED|nr:ISL3 family transposase [Virgibacillus sp. NKC19-3]MBY7142164.1 ISL3 family transposase [Virgibacillus sp. NKC19-3]MBY7142986.1 ISL3 family transposase [Virgibacillus sp. NKC19-3]MBY7143113.1 ISL3 family transposase [Virgibacillus sp. NKC19-3]MBY7144053.1 ISL3 family transposase [Virgibacillus sp. NKC19-3]